RRRPRRHAGRGAGLCRDGCGPVRAGEDQSGRGLQRACGSAGGSTGGVNAAGDTKLIASVLSFLSLGSSSHEAMTTMDTTASPEVKHRDRPLNPVMLRELSAKSDAQGIVRIVSHYSAMAVVGTLIWVVSSANGIAWALQLLP